MLALQHCQIHFKQHCVLTIDELSIKPEGISVILGANGSGKTLLLKLLAGLIKTDGKINQDPLLKYPQKTWVPHSPALLNQSVYDNIAIPLKYQNHLHIDQRVKEALAWADIESLANHLANTLSTGQKQLVALARAWALKPELLLLDEPCANLDPRRQQQIETLIQTLSTNGCKIIMSTHHISQAKRLSSDIIFLHQGKVLIHTKNNDFFDDQEIEKAHGKEAATIINDFLSFQ